MPSPERTKLIIVVGGNPEGQKLTRLWMIVAAVVLFAALFGGTWAAWHARSKRLREKSDIEHARLARAAAERGNAAAEAEIGHLYPFGLGVSRDPGQALRWFQLAASQGNARGEAGVGALYYLGFGVQRDYKQAFQWYQKAADQNLTLADYWLATMYVKGYGVRQNDEEAFRWYRKAADQQDPGAEYAIGWMYEYGRGVPQNRAEAHLWLVRAADHGDPYARHVVAVPLTWLEESGMALVALIGIALCLGYPRPLLIGPGLQNMTPGALTILISAFNWYGYTHHWFRNFVYGVTPLTVIHWLSVVALIAIFLYAGRSGRRPNANSNRTEIEQTTS